ncbi:MAG TPA: hypothetical protein VNU45_02880 [Rummeliibacillus sp.]|nr:hypothetical protein [Rummeliibacillus sp.]
MEFEGEEEPGHLQEENQRCKREIVLGEKEVADNAGEQAWKNIFKEKG